VKNITDRILLGLVLALGVALAWVVKGTLDDHIVRVGDIAPKFSVVTETGRTITPASFGGKLLVLNFWADWCPPCRQEAPSLEVFSRQFASEGVVVLGVSVDKNENLYHRFLKEYRVTFQVTRDPSSEISDSYGTFQFPETYVIDTSGKVVQKIIGAQNWMSPEFVQSIKKIL
jgi:cytochrome c biogenesis protein CcmG, thiol:disulfide interchange protein DsbE